MNFYPRLRVNVFVIQHDGSLGEPQIQKKTFNDKEVWVVSVNMYVDKPRILPMPLVDRIRLLEPMMNEDVAMSGLNDSSMSESGDSNSSELVTLTIITTRAEATLEIYCTNCINLMLTRHHSSRNWIGGSASHTIVLCHGSPEKPSSPWVAIGTDSSCYYENDVQTENCPRKIEGDVARIVIAVEQITTSCHNSKADVTVVWSLCLQQQGNAA
ncbi:unnamed protein product [Fusarium fujikuroi]|nr:unnamed protein product [Fusarium fujikuroi]